MKIKPNYLALLILLLGWMTVPAQTQDRPPGLIKYPHYIRVTENIPVGQAKKLLRERFNMQSVDELRLVESIQGPSSFTHQKFQQYYRGVKVEDAVCTVHSKNGQIYMISGNYRDVQDLNIRSNISSQAGFNKAVSHINANRYMWDEASGYKKPTGDLVILADAQGQQPARLAYKYDIYALEPLSRKEVFIDARTGQFLSEKQCLHTTDEPASGTSLYDGTVAFTAENTGSAYRLRQQSDGGGIETYDMNNNTNYGAASDVTSSSSFFTTDDTAVQTHWGAEQTYRYFFQKHGRNSFDNGGAVIRAYVHYAGNYVNAFWDGQRVTFGDGDGVNYSPLVSLDIVAHEIAHGVTDFSADLIYSYESGALNESFSDIFGETVEYYATGTNDWQVGADIRITGSGGIRSMSNPKSKGDPDTYQGDYWYTGAGDNGGVHINSGVQNKWFHILTVGEAGTNDLGNAYSVNGIGMDKAAAIAYRNLTVYLTPTSNYFDAREGAIQAAIDLYGEGSPEEISTTNAWYAVGVGGSYGSISYCGSAGNNSTYEWIAGVSVGGFTNNSGSTGYSDFTAQTIDLAAGQTYAVSLTPGFSGNSYLESWKIWIDYNGDGDFTDAGELAFNPGELSEETVTGTLSVPTGVSGTTRLRVSMKWNSEAGPCESFPYGEVEDYTVAFGAENDTEPPSVPSGLATSMVTEISARLTWDNSTDNVAVTGYEVFLDGALEGTTTNTFYDFSGLSPATTYTLSVRARDGAGNRSASASIGVTTTEDTGGGTSYCSSQGENHSYEWIAGVSVGSFSNASGSAGYSDFTSKVIALSPGAASSFSLQPGFSSSAYDEYWRVWIDYNGDGDFSDAGELVFDAGGTSQTTVSGTINVPATASGATRLRVAMRWNNAPSPCGSFSYGEVEDYGVQFDDSGEGGDQEPPTPPTNLAAFNTTQDATGLSWVSASDNVGVTGYEVFVDGQLAGTTATTTYAVTGLSPATSYTMSVKARDAAGNRSAEASIVVLTLPESDPDDGPAYCASEGQSVAFEWIAKVTIGSFSNASGAAGYSDFTDKVIELSAGQSHSINLEPGFASTAYDEYWRMWIDYNGDGDFNDSGELVFDPGGTSKSAVSGTIDIPASASGMTRLRVSMKWGNPPAPCETFNHGEVEDYSLQFGDGDGDGSDTQAPSAPSNLTASNTTSNATDLSWIASTDNVGVTGYEVFVDGQLAGTTAATAFTVTGLSPSTSYMMSVKARDAAGNRSAASVITVTTPGSGGGSEVVFGHYFETGWDGWSSGGSDCDRYAGSFSYEGSYSIRLRDNSGIASSMTSGSYDLRDYSQLDLRFYFFPNSMEAGERFLIRYHDGSSWTTVASFVSGEDFENLDFYEGVVSLSSADYNFSQNSRFRFQCDASSNFDHVYIDAVTLTGISSSSLQAAASIPGGKVGRLGLSRRPVTGLQDPDFDQPSTEKFTFELFPNPATDWLNVRLPADVRGVKLMTATGQLLANEVGAEPLVRLDVSGLSPGFYLISVQTSSGWQTARFIKH